MDENVMADNVEVSNINTSEGIANPQPTETTSTDTAQTTPQNVSDSNNTDITTTQAFSQRLKESTQKAIDAEYDRLYGAEYGIHSKVEYDAAVARQAQEEQNERFRQEHGVDPESIKPYFEQWKMSDPDFQELNSIRQANNVSKALSDLNAELKENGVDLQLTDLSDSEVAKIPNVDKVTEYVAKGHTLADAVFLANKKDFIARQAQQVQQDTIKKISANGASSPGSLAGGISEEGHISFESFEANKKDQGWVNKNFKKIIESRAKW